MRNSSRAFYQNLRHSLEIRRDALSQIPLEEVLRKDYARNMAEGRPNDLPCEIRISKSGDIITEPNPDYEKIWSGRREHIENAYAVEAMLSSYQEEERQLLSEEQETAAACRQLDDEHGRALVDGPHAKTPKIRLPFPWKETLGYCVIGSGIVLEGYQLSFPLLNSMGVDVANLAREWERNPVTILFGIGFAMTVSASVFVLSFALVALAFSLYEKAHGKKVWKILVESAVFLGCLSLYGALAALIGGMRGSFANSGGGLSGVLHSTSTHSDGQLSNNVFLLLTFIVPLAAAFLGHIISKSPIWATRKALQEERKTWEQQQEEDRQQAWTFREREKILKNRQSEIAKQRANLQAAIASLRNRSVNERQQRLAALEKERRDQENFAAKLIASLHKSKVLYLRYGANLGHSLNFVVFFIALILGGCSSSPGGETASHVYMLCAASADHESVSCGANERVNALNTWINGALYRPSSSFTIWAVGSDRKGYYPFFTTCIPPSWGPGVFEAKTMFIEKARAEVVGERKQTELLETCIAPGSRRDGSDQVVLSPTLFVDTKLWENIRSPPEGAKAIAPLHQMVLCDLSSSAAEETCTPEERTYLFDLWLMDNFAQANKASFSLFLVGSSYDTVQPVFGLDIPALETGEKFAFLFSARNELAQVNLKKGSTASAIAEAVSFSVTRLRERTGRYRLAVLSDLRQYTQGKWNFEREVPSAPEFISWIDKQKLRVDLRSITVWACGLHNQRSTGSGPYTPDLMKKTQDIWSETFHHMGAEDVQLFSICREHVRIAEGERG